MDELQEKIKKIMRIILHYTRLILSSKWFVFFTAAYFLLMYYLGLDLGTIYFVGIIGTLMVLLLDDLTPLVGQFPFMSIMISASGSPAEIQGGSDFFYRTETVVQIGLVIGVYACAMITRLVLTCVRGKFKITPVTIGLFALSAAFLLNGAFGKDYQFMDTVYGAIMVFFFLIIFITMSHNVTVSAGNIKRICFNWLVFSAVLLVELVVCYITNGVITADGSFIKEKVIFGWGVWNTMGMLLTVSIPFMFYLACKSDRGYLYFLYASLLLVAAFATTSRQAMLVSSLLYAVCWVIMLIKGKNRKINIIISAVLITSLIVVVIVGWGVVVKLFAQSVDSLTTSDGSFDGNGRTDLISQAWNNFKSSPIFGDGFFAPVEVSAHFVGLGGVIPDMYHNTLAEMLGACGILGIAAYIFYRVQTVRCFIKNYTFDRMFIAFAVLGLLLTSMFDNHMFYILPTMFYSGLMPFVVNDKTPEETAAEEPPQSDDGGVL